MVAPLRPVVVSVPLTCKDVKKYIGLLTDKRNATLKSLDKKLRRKLD